MRNNKWLFFIMVLLAAASFAFADVKPASTLPDLVSNGWKLNFTPKNGFDLSYKGVNLLRRTDLNAYHGQYTSSYFNYLEGKNKIVVSNIPDGKCVTIAHVSDTFRGTQTISLLPNRVVFHLEYGMPSTVTDGLMDYCFGYISAQPFVGHTYTLKGPSGERSGIIPVKSDQQEYNYAPELYTDATLDSSIGKVHIKLDGELPGLQLRDFRYSKYIIAEGAPVFWSGIWNVHLDAGHKYSETITISIDPVAKAPAAARNAQSGPALSIPCRDVKTTPGGELRIIPEPKEIHPLSGYFSLNAQTTIVVARNAAEKDLSGAEQLAAEVKSLYGIKLKIVRDSESISKDNAIFVGERGRNNTLDSFVKAENMAAPKESEGYSLMVSPERILVLGYDQAGSFYGMQSLRQLLIPHGEGTRIHACKVTDWPSLKFRGIILFLGKDALPFHEKLIDRILTKYKYNALILECDYLKWKTNPKMAIDFAMSQDDLKKDVAYAKKNFIEPIPLVQSLGHCEWAFKNGQNMDIVEDKSSPYAFCPSNPKSYDFIFSLIDEAYELFDHPRYFHIGHDEVSMIGKFPACPTCIKKTETELFLENTNKVHDYLEKKGAKVMMWGDMLLGPNEALGANNAHSDKEAEERRAGLPKDIIINDWHYYPANPDQYPSLGIFKKDGFDSIAATWDNPANICNFTEAAKREGIMGHLLTLWVGYNSNEKNVKAEKSQFNIIPLAGDYAWNTGATPVEMAPYKSETLFDNDFYAKKRSFAAADGFCVNISPFYNAVLNTGTSIATADKAGMGSMKEAILQGRKFLFPAQADGVRGIRLASTSDGSADFPISVKIPVSLTARSLIFLHTTVKYDDPAEGIGVYRITYADGTSADAPIVFGRNIGESHNPAILSDADIIWNGTDAGGEKIVLRSMEWTNPYPEKKIVSIEAISKNSEAGITLVGISGTSGE